MCAVLMPRALIYHKACRMPYDGEWWASSSFGGLLNKQRARYTRMEHTVCLAHRGVDPSLRGCICPVRCIKVREDTDRVSICPLSTPLRLASQGTVSLSALRTPPGRRVAGGQEYRMPPVGRGRPSYALDATPFGLNRIVQMAS